MGSLPSPLSSGLSQGFRAVKQIAVHTRPLPLLYRAQEARDELLLQSQEEDEDRQDRDADDDHQRAVLDRVGVHHRGHRDRQGLLGVGKDGHQGPEVGVPLCEEHVDRGRGEARLHRRGHDADEDAELARAVDARRLHDLGREHLEVLPHEENDEDRHHRGQDYVKNTIP